VKDPRRYYDDFSKTYDRPRSDGYHAFIDDLETECVRRWMPGPRVLEVGCGTGQILKRVRAFAPAALGVDLSGGMLAHARARGLTVGQASATQLPFPDRSFDLVYSFKVLPHIPDLAGAIAEVHRVLDAGGVAVLEFYNTRSLRVWWKKARWWRVKVGEGSHDREVHTTYHSPAEVRALVPPDARLIGHRGVIIATPHAHAHRVPVAGAMLRGVERVLSAPLAGFGGFYIVAFRREDGSRT
jgi:ubiquinone/menaquinone biosynthesis C-methylase UbiE